MPLFNSTKCSISEFSGSSSKYDKHDPPLIWNLRLIVSFSLLGGAAPTAAATTAACCKASSVFLALIRAATGYTLLKHRNSNECPLCHRRHFALATSIPFQRYCSGVLYHKRTDNLLVSLTLNYPSFALRHCSRHPPLRR